MKRHVKGVKGVKHCTVIPIKDQKAMYKTGLGMMDCNFNLICNVRDVE